MGEICYAGDCVETIRLGLSIWSAISFMAFIIGLISRRNENLEIDASSGVPCIVFSIFEFTFTLWLDGMKILSGISIGIVGGIVFTASMPIWIIPYAVFRYMALKKWMGKDGR